MCQTWPESARTYLAAELEGRVSHCARGGNQVLEQHALVRRGPFLVDADVAGSVLHGRDAGRSENVAVAHVAQAPVTAHVRLLPRGELLAFGEVLDQRVAALHFHRVLAP